MQSINIDSFPPGLLRTRTLYVKPSLSHPLRPVCHVSSNSEDEPAYIDLLTFAYNVFREHGIDISEKVKYVYMDGHEGAANAVKLVLPNAIIKRDLEHVKRNVQRNTAKLGTQAEELMPLILEKIMFTATVASDQEFDVCWKSFFAELVSKFPAAAKFVEYFQTEHLVTTDGVFSSPWRSGVNEVLPGYATYVSNTIERYHRTLKALLPHNMQSLDFTEFVSQFKTLLDGWLAAEKFAGWQFPLVDHIAQKFITSKSEFVVAQEAAADFESTRPKLLCFGFSFFSHAVLSRDPYTCTCTTKTIFISTSKSHL